MFSSSWWMWSHRHHESIAHMEDHLMLQYLCRYIVAWIQFSWEITHAANAKSLTSQYNAHTRPLGIEPKPLNTWWYPSYTMNHWEVLWLGGHLTKKNDHIPLQHHNYTNPTTTRSSNHSIHMVNLVTMIAILPCEPKIVPTCVLNI